MICLLEGRLATLERGGGAGRGRGLRRGTLERGRDHSAGSKWVRTGRTEYVGRVLGFFESAAVTAQAAPEDVAPVVQMPESSEEYGDSRGIDPADATSAADRIA